jgi:PBP1b-binding outer membrane lipoprotein LpoB
MKTWNFLFAAAALAFWLAGCSATTLSANPAPKLDMAASWVLLPSINNTETPQAGGRLDSITASLMRARGVNLSMYAASGQGDDGAFDSADRHQQQQALERASKQGFRYAVAGSVNEWRYKVGVEGEPVAGISLSIIDVASGRVVWSGSAARTGSSQRAVSATAQDLVNSLLDRALSNPGSAAAANVTAN